MHQLFLNLFTNALKFNDGAPHISVQAVLIRAKERAGRKLPPENDWIEIVFSDNGIGFDPQYAGQLFSIFQRLHTADKYAGTGIGLALCKKIVENHNGIITVESAPGEGTSFYVYLPYSPDTVQWPQMESRQPAAGV
jgi:signal transduction histidine kinase